MTIEQLKTNFRQKGDFMCAKNDRADGTSNTTDSINVESYIENLSQEETRCQELSQNRTETAAGLSSLAIPVDCAYKTTRMAPDEVDLFYFLYMKAFFIPDCEAGLISMDEAEDCTGLSKDRLDAAFDALVARNILCRKNGKSGQSGWYINMDGKSWK